MEEEEEEEEEEEDDDEKKGKSSMDIKQSRLLNAHWFKNTLFSK